MLNALSQLIFGNPSLTSKGIFGRIRDGSKLPIWRDRSLCFDLKANELCLDQGEQLIACFIPIEDVKGNSDVDGLLQVTNLRLIWICCKRPQINLSIGWHTVTMAFEQNFKDPLGQTQSSLCILSRYESTKYEFIFNRKHTSASYGSDSVFVREYLRYHESLQLTRLSPMSMMDAFTIVYKVWQSYKQTNLFRQCKSNLTHLLTRESSNDRGCGFKLNELNRLPDEEIVESHTGVEWIESKTAKHVGTLLLSNIRILWVDEDIPLRNFSVPYIRIESIRLRQGGDRMMINTCDYVCNTTSIKLRLLSCGLSMLAFNIEEHNQTKALFNQIQKLYTSYKSRPKYGPESCDECITFISYLKTEEEYSKTGDSTLVEKPKPSNQSVASPESVGTSDKIRKTYDEQLESAEEQLAGTNINYKLNSYLDERPLRYDKDLVYSKGKSMLTH